MYYFKTQDTGQGIHAAPMVIPSTPTAGMSHMV